MYEIILSFFLTYLIGSVNFAYLAGRLKGKDLREEGSGNLGAKNVQRVLGSSFAIAVLALDVLKGGAGVFVAMALSGEKLAAFIGWLGIVCGHGWPVFLKFRGGKGLASSAGALMVISPFLLVVELVAGMIILIISRNFYIAAIIMTAFLPIMVYILKAGPSLVVASFVISALIIYLHKKNILEIRSGLGRKFKT